MDVKELSKQSQIHGLNKIHGKLRWIWLLLLLILLGFAVNIVNETVTRYLERSTYMVTLEKTRKVMEFPLVQVCPEINFPDEKMDNFLSKIRFPPALNRTYIRGILRQMSSFYSPDVRYNIEDLKNIEHLLYYNGLDIYTASVEMTQSCEETLLKCRWQGLKINCQKLFNMELTSYGFCCIFNGRSLRREIQEYGIHKVTPALKYYTRSVGFTSGLVVAINQSSVHSDIDLSYKWVAIDGGQNYVEGNINGTPLSPGTELWIGHKNKGFNLGDDARSLDTNLRGCHLTMDKLVYFPVYRRKYCQLECKIGYYIRACSCALITFPVPPSIPRCQASQMDCIKRASNRFSVEKCDCTHTCDVDTDHAKLDMFHLTSSAGILVNFYDHLNFSQTTVVRVFIIRRDVKTNSRRAVYTYLDLFAQLGGVFNLFFGFSILSVLELLHLVYHYLKTQIIHKRKDSKSFKKDIKNNVKIRKLRPREIVRVKETVYKNHKTVRFNPSEVNYKVKSKMNF